MGPAGQLAVCNPLPKNVGSIPLLANFAFVAILYSKTLQVVKMVEGWAFNFSNPAYKSLTSSWASSLRIVYADLTLNSLVSPAFQTQIPSPIYLPNSPHMFFHLPCLPKERFHINTNWKQPWEFNLEIRITHPFVLPQPNHPTIPNLPCTIILKAASPPLKHPHFLQIHPSKRIQAFDSWDPSIHHILIPAPLSTNPSSRSPNSISTFLTKQS